ncbi:MAG: radical SAM family heme chaperone HemW [Paludibacter sp.]|nr:radical SAM family heme chaperone HemW [Paludibacter sp.]
MAGIYIHIPFCKKRCTYCDFYTEVATQFIPTLIDSIVKELHIRKDYIQNETIKTIYFGGGTPSILNKSEFKMIFDAIFSLFEVESDAEITFEANPDDLTTDYLNTISFLPFNRISIGIQSFEDEDLKRINRRHTSNEAINAVKDAQMVGFKNISIDLIYGLPFQSVDAWRNQLDVAFSLGIQHISAYGLTYEEGTELWKQREEGIIDTIDDETMNKMYELLLETVSKNGFEAYEISNFAQPGFRSKHNTSYWKNEIYIGVGPSAHSFNLESRQWNVNSINQYIKAINENSNYFEKEDLSIFDKYNDYIMVSLRTSDGIDLEFIKLNFGDEFVHYCLQNIKTFIDSEKVDYNNDKIRLTSAGNQISNLIIMQLMKV